MAAPPDFSDMFNTQLEQQEEAAFQDYIAKSGRSRDLADYDMRGAFKAGLTGKDGHLPDTYKKPNHPTFSDESQYSGGAYQGGKWEKQDGRWTYTPSGINLLYHGGNGLQDYFNRVEPDSTLIMRKLQPN